MGKPPTATGLDFFVRAVRQPQGRMRAASGSGRGFDSLRLHILVSTGDAHFGRSRLGRVPSVFLAGVARLGTRGYGRRVFMYFVGAVVLIVLWQVVDAISASRRVQKILRDKGIVKSPRQTTMARINPGGGRRAVTYFDGLQAGRACFVVITKPWFGSDIAVDVRER